MGNNHKVLVIDDSPFIFKMVKKALEPDGFEMVGHAENGKIGFEMFLELKPDIITLDITMPIMDGLEAATKIYEKDPDAKIIMMSAMGDEDLIESAKKIGVKNFLPKPFKSEDLLKIANDLLR